MDILTILGIGFVGLVAIALYILVKVPGTYKLKYVLIPLLLALAVAFMLELPTILGLPKEGYPTQKFSLVGYKATFVGEKLFIEAWVTEAGKSRLYRFPYDQKTAEQLKKMAGDPAKNKGKFKASDKGNGGPPELATVEVPVEPLPPKDQ